MAEKVRKMKATNKIILALIIGCLTLPSIIALIYALAGM